MDYFIDECGQTGDIASLHALTGFDDQPIFCLAAIGVADALSFEEKMNRLRQKHGIRSTELKSSARRGRLDFTYDLVELICAERFPFFLEIMDKKFVLATHITSRQLIPPIQGLASGPETHLFQNLVADYLFERLPAHVFGKFVKACLTPAHRTLMEELSTLIEFARTDFDGEHVAVIVGDLATSVQKEYLETRKEGRKDAFFDYLPVPDDNKYQKRVWILPNLSAFTNIYARINLFHQGNIKDVRLIHDEQLQFDAILELSKTQAESLRERAEAMFTPHSDFNFRESACLSFANSANSIGLQVADMLAGFCMRYVKDFFTARNRISPIAHRTYDLLRRFTDPNGGVGMNLVVSSGRWQDLTLFRSK